jgi:hypothetical protein
MSRSAKEEVKPKKVSERDMIFQYRNSLHGERAKKFDEVFYPLIGVTDEGGIRKALNKTANPHKAYVAAKTAVDALGPVKDEVEEEEEEETSVEPASTEIDWNDPDLDWNNPDLWKQKRPIE